MERTGELLPIKEDEEIKRKEDVDQKFPKPPFVLALRNCPQDS